MSYHYLATPYTKFPGGLQRAHRAACIAAAKLMRKGVAVFCPIAHTHYIAVEGDLPLTDHDFWMAVDKPLFDAADALVVVKLPGWEDSRGIAQEIAWAHEQGKPVMYLEADDD